MRGDGGGGGLATSIATQPAILTELIDDVTERRSVFFPEIREHPICLVFLRFEQLTLHFVIKNVCSDKSR